MGRLVRAVRRKCSYVKFLLFREHPRYGYGDRVYIRINDDVALARIRQVVYRYGALSYDVTVIRRSGALDFGLKTWVFPEQIIEADEPC